MICKVCHNENKCPYFICHRCVNTSPQLLLPWKLTLIQERVATQELANKVNLVLEESLTRSKQIGTVQNDGVSSVLGSQLERIQTIKEVRRNNKIKHNIRQMEVKLDKKREEVRKLKELLKTPMNKSSLSGKRMISDQEELQNWNTKIKEINTFVLIQQETKLDQLSRWFGVGPTMCADADSLRLFYHPIISIEMLKENNNGTSNTIINYNMITTSMRICLNYVKLMTRILYIHIPYSFEPESGSIDGANVEYTLSLIIYCCYMICEQLGLFPMPMKGHIMSIYADITLWLEDYGIEEIIWHISHRIKFETRRSKRSPLGDGLPSGEEVVWTLPMIQDHIEELCNGGSDSTRETVILSPQRPTRDNNNTNTIGDEGHLERHYHGSEILANPNPKHPNKRNPRQNTRPLNRTTDIKDRADRWFVVG